MHNPPSINCCLINTAVQHRTPFMNRVDQLNSGAISALIDADAADISPYNEQKHAIAVSTKATDSSHAGVSNINTIGSGFHSIIACNVVVLQELNALEDDYDENGVLPEIYMEANDAKAIRNANVSEHATSQQTVMSAWQ
jgi:hypothetical protein